MRAVVVPRHGDGDVLELREVPDPVPSGDEVLVAVRACGINHLDLHIRRGLDRVVVPLPHILGSDIAGVVVNASTDGRWQPGDRVVVDPAVTCGSCVSCLSGDDHLCPEFTILGGYRLAGGYAELVCAPVRSLARLPSEVDFETAAALPVAFQTAWQLVRRAGVVPGQRVLVRTGTGGVGLATVQIAAACGAEVFALTTSEKKAGAIADAGASPLVVDDASDASGVVDALGRRSLDAVLDHLGTPDLSAWLRLIRNGGCYATCGATAAASASVDLRHVFSRNLSIHGSSLGRRVDLDVIVAQVARGVLRPKVDQVLPLERAADAHDLLESRRVTGKVVLTVAGRDAVLKEPR